MKNSEIYTAMVVGVALFLGGMIALFLISKHYSQDAPVASQSVPMAQSVSVAPLGSVMLKPVEEKGLQVSEVYDRLVAVTDKVTELYDAEEGLNWSSFDLDNNGPDPVYFCVNTWRSPQAPIRAGQTIHIDLQQKGAIKRVYLKCDPGQTSNVSFYIIK